MNQQIEKSKQSFSLRARGKSIGYALAGMIIFIREEHNARIHFIATLLLVVVTLLVPINRMESIALIVAAALVWIAEIFNTAIERLADCYSTKRDDRIKQIKDLSAAAVLVSAIIALVTGLIIFIPKIHYVKYIF